MHATSYLVALAAAQAALASSMGEAPTIRSTLISVPPPHPTVVIHHHTTTASPSSLAAGGISALKTLVKVLPPHPMVIINPTAVESPPSPPADNATEVDQAIERRVWEGDMGISDDATDEAAEDIEGDEEASK